MTEKPGLPDPNLHAWRYDLADENLRGKVEATKYVKSRLWQVVTPVAPLFSSSETDKTLTSELLFGETFKVFEEKENWCWGQAGRDGYVGYVPRKNLSANYQKPDQKVAVLRTPLFAWPDLKADITGYLHRHSLLLAGAKDDHYLQTPAGWVHAGHVQPVCETATDPLAIALQYLHTPYVWGGSSSFGLDCSALVQNALLACGVSCLRDSYMQQATLGVEIGKKDGLPELQAGDLVYWKGHVGMMADGQNLLHANAYHMAVAIEPVREAIMRIEKTAGPVTSIRRLSSGYE